MKNRNSILKISLIGLIFVFSLQSCQSVGIRSPSSKGTDDNHSENSEKSYALSGELDYLRPRVEKLLYKINHPAKNISTISDQNELQNIQKTIKEIESKIQNLNKNILLEGEDLKLSVPYHQANIYNNNWRTQKEKLFINDPSHYALKDGKIDRVFTMSLSGTTKYELGIVNKVWSKALDPIVDTNNDDDDIDEKNMNSIRYFDANIKCDGAFKINNHYIIPKTVSKNQEFHFKIYEQRSNSPKIFLQINQSVKSCEIYFKNSESQSISYGVRLVSDTTTQTQIDELKNRFETCVLPDASNLKGMERIFLTPKYKSMTCAEELTDIKTIERPIDGLKSRAETLLGQELPEKFIIDMNPYGELNFSNAPKFKTILISSLVFRHDFYGTTLARLVKWHADNGTQVRIIISEVTANKKDLKMLHDLVETSNNIKVQEYKFDTKKSDVWEIFSEFHRISHVKLFITLADKTENNTVFMGGRNIHDGFIFMKLPDISAFPELVQYGKGKDKDEAFVPWRDFEIKITSKQFAENVASHFLTFWQRDSDNFYIRSINLNVVSSNKADPKYFDRPKNSALVRHILSVPYKDDEALENFYIDILDSAEKSVRISTPYFRLTENIQRAIERAIGKGVDISLITRLDLKDDSLAAISMAVNKAGVNNLLNKIKIYNYTEPGVILHSKLMLIDGKLSIIGSVNLNSRSFVHDIESVVMIYGPDQNKKMNDVLDVFQKQSKEITESQKIIYWKKIIIAIMKKEF